MSDDPSTVEKCRYCGSEWRCLDCDGRPKEPVKVGKRWGHADDEHGPFIGDFETREECIADAREYHYDDFYIARGDRCFASEFIVDSDDVIEHMGERASDEIGEAADEFPYASDEAKKELDALLQGWAEKHVECRFWQGDGHTEHIEIEA